MNRVHFLILLCRSTFGALINILKSSLGMGILAMPMAFKNAGYIFGIIATIGAGIVVTHCVHILVSASTHLLYEYL